MQTLKELLDKAKINQDQKDFFIKNNIDPKLAEKILDGELTLDCAMTLAKYCDFNYGIYSDWYGYVGKFDSMEEFAEHIVICCEYFGEVSEELAYFIDYKKLADSLTKDYIILDNKYIFIRHVK